MVHRYAVKISGKERVVEIEEINGAGYRIVVDGVERKIEAREVEPGVWSLLEGVAQTIAQIDGTAPKLTIEIGRLGESVVVPVEVIPARSAAVAALVRREDAGAGKAVTLRAPMPGRVVKILVKVGDLLAAGQAAVVVEAMKMENELRAPRGGVVKELRCAEGAAVEAGQDLVVIG
ncbi:MAG TPA: biotin/lipoyl-containing protein [Polyangia bacterium]|jgi:biotin carboxyl carrier protein|nr:biotin/lipoyl-containing protein [Polyangia bacterium]